MGATIARGGRANQLRRAGGGPRRRAGGASRAPRSTPARSPASSTRFPCWRCSPRGRTGTTVFRDVGELRVKESDRLGLIAENIRAVGGQAEVRRRRSHRARRRERRRGGGCEPPATTGWPWRSRCWARCPAPGSRSTIWRCAAVSFPGFPDDASRDRRRSRAMKGGVIAIDGPAASGKSSTARAVAEALGLRAPRFRLALSRRHAGGAARGGSPRPVGRRPARGRRRRRRSSGRRRTAA